MFVELEVYQSDAINTIEISININSIDTIIPSILNNKEVTLLYTNKEDFITTVLPYKEVKNIINYVIKKSKK